MSMNKVLLKILKIIFETHATLEMKQRASTEGCLNYEGVPTDGCSKIYVGAIEIIFQNVAASQISSKHENEDLVAIEEVIRLLPHHYWSFMKLVQVRRKKMRRFICKSLILFKGP